MIVYYSCIEYKLNDYPKKKKLNILNSARKLSEAFRCPRIDSTKKILNTSRILLISFENIHYKTPINTVLSFHQIKFIYI